jgi:hypothetical protein
MISGPLCPRNREGLRELMELHLAEVERGLLIVEVDVELESGCSIDGLAMDAAGRPVLLFAADGEGADELPAHVLAARAWLSGSGSALLARFVSRDGLDWALAPRFVVLAFEMRPLLQAQLADLSHLGVEVYQVRSFRLGGRQLIGAVPLTAVAPAPHSEPFACTRALGGSPDSATDAALRFLDLMQRLDTAIEVRNDGDTRRLCVAGCRLAELAVVDGVPTVHVPAGAGHAANGAAPVAPMAFELRCDSDVRDAVDRTIARYLTILHARAADDAPRVADEVPARSEPRSPLERLRRACADSRITPEEYSVLGESGTRDD